MLHDCVSSNIDCTREPFEIRPPGGGGGCRGGGAVVKKIQIALTSLIFDIQKCANNILCFKLDFAHYGTIKSDILVKKKIDCKFQNFKGLMNKGLN